MTSQHFLVTAAQSGQTIAGLLRSWHPGQSWTDARKLLSSRRVLVGGELCCDAARRLKEGDKVEVRASSMRLPSKGEEIHVRFVDEHLVVVEKPAGLCSVRHPAERDWPTKRKKLSPTLEDLVIGALARTSGKPRKGTVSRLRVVQRLDKHTSGLIVFARTVAAERGLGRQFHAHTVTRRYIAIVPGSPLKQRIATTLVRDRGDGRRGSGALEGQGKKAVTHIDVIERLANYSVVSCQLETGRTHQIRIHLAELGHPICGEKVYSIRLDGTEAEDRSRAPRLALHAAELGFLHPVTGISMHWTMPLPADLDQLVARLRSQPPPRGGEKKKSAGDA